MRKKIMKIRVCMTLEMVYRSKVSLIKLYSPIFNILYIQYAFNLKCFIIHKPWKEQVMAMPSLIHFRLKQYNNFRECSIPNNVMWRTSEYQKYCLWKIHVTSVKFLTWFVGLNLGQITVWVKREQLHQWTSRRGIKV